MRQMVHIIAKRFLRDTQHNFEHLSLRESRREKPLRRALAPSALADNGQRKLPESFQANVGYSRAPPQGTNGIPSKPLTTRTHRMSRDAVLTAVFDTHGEQDDLALCGTQRTSLE